jgi:hypothetical protein
MQVPNHRTRKKRVVRLRVQATSRPQEAPQPYILFITLVLEGSGDQHLRQVINTLVSQWGYAGIKFCSGSL